MNRSKLSINDNDKSITPEYISSQRVLQNDQYNIDKIASPISKVSQVYSQGRGNELSSVTEETFDAFDQSDVADTSHKKRISYNQVYDKGDYQKRTYDDQYKGISQRNWEPTQYEPYKEYQKQDNYTYNYGQANHDYNHYNDRLEQEKTEESYFESEESESDEGEESEYSQSEESQVENPNHFQYQPQPSTHPHSFQPQTYTQNLQHSHSPNYAYNQTYSQSNRYGQLNLTQNPYISQNGNNLESNDENPETSHPYDYYPILQNHL